MPRRLSVPGLIVFLAGAAALFLEWRYSLLRTRMGVVGLGGLGATLGYLFGGLAAAVGAQQLVTAALAKQKANLLNRDRFYAPTAGRVFVVILIALFVGSFVGKSNPLLLVFSLMAPLLVFNGFISYTQLRRVRCEREPPPRAEAGRAVPVTVAMTGLRARLPVWMMTVTDRIDGPFAASGNGGPRMVEPLRPLVAFLKIPAGQTVRRTYRVRIPKRGRYRVGPLQIDTRFPLGLVERGLIVGEAADLLVHPRVGRVNAGWRRKLTRTREQAAGVSRRAGSFDDDFHRVRDYQTGDDPRAIHWATSARRGSLVVREFREARDRPLAVLVDLWTDGGKEADARAERALELAATLSVDHLRTSQRAGLYCCVAGADLQAWDSAERTDVGGLLDLMAVAEAGEGAPEATAALWRDRPNRDERVIWITSRAGGLSGPVLGGLELPPECQELESDEETAAAVAYFG